MDPVPVIFSAPARRVSTGRSVAPTSRQATAASSANSTANPTINEVRATRTASSMSPAGTATTTVLWPLPSCGSAVSATTRTGPSTPNRDAVHGDRPAAGRRQLVGGQRRDQPIGARGGGQHPALRIDDLHERRPTGGYRVGQPIAVDQHHHFLRGLQHGLVGRPFQSEPQHDDDAPPRRRPARRPGRRC